jgi:hypothetical protein
MIGFQMFVLSMMSNVHYKMMAIGLLIKMETGTITNMVKDWLTVKKRLVMKFKIELVYGPSLNLKKEREMVDTGSMIWMANGSLQHTTRSTIKKEVSDIGLKTSKEIILLLNMKNRKSMILNSVKDIGSLI